MVGNEIGALFVRIGSDISDLRSGIGPGGKADKELEGFTNRVNAGLGNLLKFGAALGAIGVGAALVGLVTATKAAADFQAKLTTLVTGAGESEKNISLVSDGLLKMAGEVGQSASTLADGLFMIESAGFHGAEGLNVLKAAAEGAKVGGADMATVADAVTTVLRDYHMSAGQAADATNFLVAVVKQGKTHMQDLAQSLAMVLPFASALHVPLDQIGGAMATMTAKGIPAADAATYLRFTMAALANETPKGKKALEEIGLTGDKVAASLTSRGLLPTLEMIQAQLSKKFPEGGAKMFAALADIVGGTRGLGAALQLTGMNLNDFIASTQGVSDAMKNGKGQVIGWSDVQKDFNFQMDAAKAGLEAAGIKVGTKLIPPLTNLFKNVIVPLIPKLADMGGTLLDRVLPPVESFAGWLSKLKPDFQKAYDIISTLKPYLIDVGVAWVAWNVALAVTKGIQMSMMALQFVMGLIQIIRTVGLATAAQWLWNVAMDANPIGLVIGAIALLAAGVIYAYTHFDWFRNFVNAAWHDLQAFGNWLRDNLWPIIQDIGNAIGGVGGAISAIGSAAHDAHIPGFALGGVVPGPVGAPMLAVVHGGEQVLTPAQQQQRGGGSGAHVTIYAQTEASPSEIAREMVWALKTH